MEINRKELEEKTFQWFNSSISDKDYNSLTTTLFPNIFGSHAKNAGPSAWMCTTSYFPNAL